MDFNNLLKIYLSDNRLNHSKRVAETAKRLAGHYGLNGEDLYCAGLLHDIAKQQTPELLTAKGLDVSKLDMCWQQFPSVWHALVAEDVIEYECPGQYSHIFDCMRYHTTGHADMNDAAKVLFVADFIEPERTHSDRLKVEDMAMSSLESAVAWITYCSILKLTQKQCAIHPYTINCWNFFSKYIITKS
jgi:predicted HD superfamily hydrolase involved in NAD metabolism